MDGSTKLRDNPENGEGGARWVPRVSRTSGHLIYDWGLERHSLSPVFLFFFNLFILQINVMNIARSMKMDCVLL